MSSLVNNDNFLKCFRCGSVNASVEQLHVTHCPSCGMHLMNAPVHQAAQEDVQLRKNDKTFASPYVYERTLMTVPGKFTAVPMCAGQTDEIAQALRGLFVPRESDVWIATYPKSGTTWVQEMLSQLLYGEPNVTKGEELGVGLSADENIMWLEVLCSMCITQDEHEDFDLTDASAVTNAITPLVTEVNAKERRRCFKTHSPIGLLQTLLTPQSKIIHVARNPRDVAVSMWHHSRSKNFGYEGPWEHFLEKLFLSGEVESGSWWDFVIPYLLCEKGVRDCYGLDGVAVLAEQVMTVWYEDLLEDPEREVLRMASFLGVNDVGESMEVKAANIVDACSFSALKSREQKGGLRLTNRIAVADFSAKEGSATSICRSHIRKGGSGGWKDYFTADQEESFQKVHAKWAEQYDCKSMEINFA